MRTALCPGSRRTQSEDGEDVCARVDVLVEVDAYIDDLAGAVGVGFVGWSRSDRDTLRVGLTVHLVAGLVIESIIEAAQLDARPAGCDSAVLPPSP